MNNGYRRRSILFSGFRSSRALARTCSGVRVRDAGCGFVVAVDRFLVARRLRFLPRAMETSLQGGGKDVAIQRLSETVRLLIITFCLSQANI